MITERTRLMIGIVAAHTVAGNPEWRALIRKNRDLSFEEWRARFQVMIDAGILDRVFANAARRGDSGEEMLRLFWEETRRVALDEGVQQ